MKKIKNNFRFVDSLQAQRKNNYFVSIFDFKRYIWKYLSGITKSVLFSRQNRTNLFFTEDSKKYITPREAFFLKRGLLLKREGNYFDSATERIVKNYMLNCSNYENNLSSSFLKRYKKFKDNFQEESILRLWHLNPQKIWNASIIGAILLGMVSMTFIYRYLGESVAAKSKNKPPLSIIEQKTNSYVLGVEAQINKDIKEEVEYISQVMQTMEEKKKEELEKEIRNLVKGYPIEEMLPYIMKKDKTVIAFIVGIAKKESNWGRRVPVLNGQDCYNYWGYRGKRSRMGTGGHTCFESRQDAVDTVAKRIEFLVSNKKLDTPSKMVIWKCGSDCEATGGQAAALKWISDVSLYFHKLNK